MNRKLYKYTLTLLLKVKGKTFLFFFFAILLDLSSDFIFQELHAQGQEMCQLHLLTR